MGSLDSMRRDLEAKVVRVANIVADQVVRELKLEAPIETGELRSKITAAVRATANGASIDLRSGAPYAQFVREHREEWDAMVRTLPDRIQRAWRGVR